MTLAPAQALPVALEDVPAAEWAAAIVVRHSARTFTGKAVASSKLRQLELRCESLPAPEVARVALVREVPDIVFTGFVGSYGRVLRAPSALLMIGTETARSFQESTGYLGEAAILEATSLGLGTCWIAGFFDRTVASTLVPLAPGERVLAISPIGYAEPRPRAGERMMKRMVGAHKRKPVQIIAPDFDEESWPAWAAEGVRLARVAPSAVNRQPWRFELEREAPLSGLPATEDLTVTEAPPVEAVTLSVVTKGPEGNIPCRLDCGIAMLHFEVGARLMGASGRWESLEPPRVARYRLTGPAENPSET